MLKHELTSPQYLRTLKKCCFPSLPSFWLLASSEFFPVLVCVFPLPVILSSPARIHTNVGWGSLFLSSLPQMITTGQGCKAELWEQQRNFSAIYTTNNQTLIITTPVTNIPPAPTSWNLLSFPKHTDNHHGGKKLKKKTKQEVQRVKNVTHFLPWILDLSFWLSFPNGTKAQLTKDLSFFFLLAVVLSKALPLFYSHPPYIRLNSIFFKNPPCLKPKTQTRVVNYCLCAYLPPMCDRHFQAPQQWRVPPPRVPKFSPALIDINSLGFLPLLD